MVKERIPRALREQVWRKYVGNKFETKCWIPWCKNKMTAFDFHMGHNIPESKGGTLDIENLRPICARCNLSMSNTYTISEWMEFAGPKRCLCFICGPPPNISAEKPKVVVGTGAGLVTNIPPKMETPTGPDSGSDSI